MIGLYLTLAALGAAVYTDFRTRKIPNRLTVTVAVGGLILQGMAGGLSGLISGLQGLGMGLLLLGIPFLLGWMGGGDVKLMGGIGAILGPGRTLYAALYSVVAGGVIALALLGWSMAAQRLGKEEPAADPPSPWRRTYPYALAIAAGTSFALWSRAGV